MSGVRFPPGPPFKGSTYVIIRLALPEDLDDIVRIERESFGARAFSRAHFERYMKKGSMHVLTINYVVYGYIVVFVRANSDTARINVVAIDPAFKGRGFGSVLLNFIERICFADYLYISLEVNVTNWKAINLYKKLGYEAVKTLPDYYGEGQTGLKMIKKLREN
ncbi:MAG: GNAT family N-acetyltransferase [Candidatus Bathyarchaeia archaeon]